MFTTKKQPPIKSLIAHGCKIEGNFTFTEGLRVDGEVIGDLLASGDLPSILVISESASVTGNVRAHHVIVNGRIQGAVFAKDLLELQPKAQIEGPVEYRALEMHQGALITGQLQPLMKDVDKPTLTLAASNG